MSKFLGALPQSGSNGGYEDYLDNYLGQTTPMDAYNQQSSYLDGMIDPNLTTIGNVDSSFLGSVGNFFGGSDGASNIGSLLGGAAGLGMAYTGYKQQKDTEKTNSLYRRIMEEEHARTNKFRSDMSQLNFG